MIVLTFDINDLIETSRHFECEIEFPLGSQYPLVKLKFDCNSVKVHFALLVDVKELNCQ